MNNNNESYASESVNNVTTDQNNVSSMTHKKKLSKGKDAQKKVALEFEAITNMPDCYKVVKGQLLEINLKLLNVSKLTWPTDLEMTAHFFNNKYIEKLQQDVEHNQIADIKFKCGPWDTEGKSKAHLQFNWVCEKTKTKYFSKKIHISVNVVSNEGNILV